MSILVIENNPAELKLAQDVLRAAGYSVRGADCAEKAFVAIQTARPEVILLDLQLPGMDGLAIARTLKAGSATSGISIVAVTSYEDRFTKTSARQSGCDGYIVKPINTRRLPGQIAAVMHRKS